MSAGPLDIVLPLTLQGSVVRLEPVRQEHAELFWKVAQDDLDDVFRWIPYDMKTREDFQRLINKAFAEQERGESVVFATVEQSSDRVIGSTRFMNIDLHSTIKRFSVTNRGRCILCGEVSQCR